MPIPMFSAAYLRDMAHDYQLAIPVADAIHQQISRWRRCALSPRQVIDIAAFQDRVTQFKALLAEARAKTEALPTTDRSHKESSLQALIGDLINDN